VSFFTLFRRRPAKTVVARVAPVRHSTAPAASVAAPAFAFTPTAPAAPLPAELSGFRWLTEQELDPARRDALLAAVRGIPRPPRSMQQLLSPEFVAKAGSADLAELVTGEPLIAAKVLGTVNGPFYGLHKPVTSIGQSVTFLGINTVRSICLQYMLADAFKPKLAEAQRCFDTICPTRARSPPRWCSASWGSSPPPPSSPPPAWKSGCGATAWSARNSNRSCWA
jgi:HDOD domain